MWLLVLGLLFKQISDSLTPHIKLVVFSLGRELLPEVLLEAGKESKNSYLVCKVHGMMCGIPGTE